MQRLARFSSALEIGVQTGFALMLTIRQWASELGVSTGTVANLRREGMPGDLAEAKRWLELRNANKRRQRFLHRDDVAPAAGEVEAEGLEGTVTRLRGLERDLANAASRAFKAGQIPESITLRREHVAAIKAIYDAESKLIKINETRGRLVSVDRALNLINDAMQSAILVLRRLPELGRDPEERRRLEAFLNGVLAEIKSGAVEGFNRAA